MKISRYREPSGLILTHFGNRHTYDDAIDALDELTEMTKGSSTIYEIIIHEDDFTIDVNRDKIEAIRGKVQTTFQQYNKGALAFVSNIELVFGLCRQLQMMTENENLAISVFRTEELARKWIKEIQSMHGVKD